MAADRRRNPILAALLSGAIPGLGQLYCREWRKGAAFFVATALVDAVAGVSQGLLEVVTRRALPASPGPLLVGSLVMVAIASASVFDAIRSARSAKD